jgi:hypothetical protein
MRGNAAAVSFERMSRPTIEDRSAGLPRPADRVMWVCHYVLPSPPVNVWWKAFA